MLFVDLDAGWSVDYSMFYRWMYLMRRSWWNNFDSLTPTHCDIKFADGHWCDDSRELNDPSMDFVDSTVRELEEKGHRSEYFLTISTRLEQHTYTINIYLSVIIISGTCYRKSTFWFQCVCHLHGISRKRCGRWRFLTFKAKLNEWYGKSDK